MYSIPKVYPRLSFPILSPIRITALFALLQFIACLFLPSLFYVVVLFILGLLQIILLTTRSFKIRTPTHLEIAYLVYVSVALLSLSINYAIGFGTSMSLSLGFDLLLPFGYSLCIFYPIGSAMMLMHGLSRSERHLLDLIIFLSSLFSLSICLHLSPFLFVVPDELPIANFAGLVIQRNIGSTPMDPTVYAFFLLVYILYAIRYFRVSIPRALAYFIVITSIFFTFSKPSLFLFFYVFASFLSWALSSLRRLMCFRVLTRIALLMFVLPTTIALVAVYLSELSSYIAPILSGYFADGAVDSGGARLDNWSHLLDLQDSSPWGVLLGFGFKSVDGFFSFGAHSQFVQSFFELGILSILLLPVLLLFVASVLNCYLFTFFDKSFVIGTFFLACATTELAFSRLFLYLPLFVFPFLYRPAIPPPPFPQKLTPIHPDHFHRQGG